MTPEEKIVAAIEEQTAWLKVEEDDPLLPVLKEIRSLARGILVVIVIGLWALVLVITAEATPLLPPLGYEIGEPPAPPPNPNVQYWHTMDVPGPQGVLPVEVFAPRLVAQLASEPAVETPEPGTAWMVLAYLGVARACQRCFRRKATKQLGNGDAFQVYCDKCIKWAITARKALEESK